MILAERIRNIREAQSLTQEEVAYHCDMTSSAYGQIERKAVNATYTTLSKIAKALNVSVIFLIDIGNPDFVEKNKL